MTNIVKKEVKSPLKRYEMRDDEERG